MSRKIWKEQTVSEMDDGYDKEYIRRLPGDSHFWYLRRYILTPAIVRHEVNCLYIKWILSSIGVVDVLYSRRGMRNAPMAWANKRIQEYNDIYVKR